jgi:3'-phosphoadenosine 5'-phosphosulfate (PAPS) 3'-phosphatase
VAPPEAESDTELATRLAEEAGRRLLVVREHLVEQGAHAWQVMDGGDTSSQRFLADELGRVRPDDAVLSEEGLEDPLGVTLSTDPPPPVPEVHRDRPRLVTSRTRAPYAAAVVATALGAEAVRLGSAGAKAMSVVRGDTDIYVHDGGMYQWDSAARPGGRSPRQPHRRLAARVQPTGPVAPRLPGLPPRVGRAGVVGPVGLTRPDHDRVGGIGWAT